MVLGGADECPYGHSSAPPKTIFQVTTILTQGAQLFEKLWFSKLYYH